MEYKEFQMAAIGGSRSVFKQIQRWDYFSKRTLGEQVFRAAVSVASNVAEGRGRGGRQERQFLDIAFGSCNEVLMQLNICGSCGLIPSSTARGLVAKYKEIRSWLESQLRVFDGDDDEVELEGECGEVPF